MCDSGWAASQHAGTLGHDCADLLVGYASRTGHAVNPTQGRDRCCLVLHPCSPPSSVT